MRIELANIEGGRGDFEKAYQPAELDLGDERVKLCGSTSISGKIRQAGPEVFIDGHVNTCAQVECDRCLTPLEIPVSADFGLEYISGGEYEEDRNVALSEEQMAVAVFDGETIDVDEIAKEQILLAVPSRSLCSENCKGFCPTCGADKNAGDCGCEEKEIDPRWAALKNLVDGK